MKEMPQKEDCGKNLNVLEPNAAKFGDVKNSHVIYTLRETFWKKDYVIEFEFRTFYKTGMLYITKVTISKIKIHCRNQAYFFFYRDRESTTIYWRSKTAKYS